MGFVSEKQFEIPQGFEQDEFPSELFGLFGLVVDSPSEVVDTGLTLVRLAGGSYGGEWHVDVYDGTLVPGTPLDETNTFGSGWCKDDTPREKVLLQTEEWIRVSDAVEWVPGSVVETPIGSESMKPYVVSGLLLVRASPLQDL